MAQINERQVVLRKGGNFTQLDNYLDRREVYAQPWNESYVLTVAAANAALIVAATTLTGFIYIDGSDADSGNGDIPAPAVAGFTAGTAAGSATGTISDTDGNILNLVSIRDASTHDPILDGSREVFALIQSANGTADHDAIVTTASSENLQLSFVYIASDGTLTLSAITATIEFHINKEFKLRNLPTIRLAGGAVDVDVIDGTTTWYLSTFDVTTGTTAGNSVLTLATGALTNGGASTQAGDTITMAAIGTFNKNTFIVKDNGAEMFKGDEVTFSAAGAIQVTRQLDIGDVLTVKDRI